MAANDIVLVAPKRTAVGSFGGGFCNTPGPELTIPIMKSIVETSGIDPVVIDDVIWAVSAQRTRLETNHARVASLRAGIPYTCTGITVQRVCISGVWVIIQAAQAIRSGDADVLLVGGTESMSTMPYTVDGCRWGGRLGGVELNDPLLDGLHRLGAGPSMGMTAENLAEKYKITREEQDIVAYNSHMRACAAIAAGKFKDEILPIPVKGRKGVVMIDTDEGPRAETTLERLAKLKPVFKEGGTVTAGNSSSMNDASAGYLVMTEKKAGELGCTPVARVVSYGLAGVDPDIMGIGPVPATQKALKKGGLKMEDIDLFEYNEAFAAQYLACEKELKLNREITNVNGSGISIGHPIGASGARIMVSLISELGRRKAKLGLAALCGGGGMGIAMVIEKL
jgi:acetyl-CoA C-acetyltransferase